MGFGNPYSDPWNTEIVGQWTKLWPNGCNYFITFGYRWFINTSNYHQLFSNLIPKYQNRFGAHLHTTPNTWHEKIHAAYQAGCLRLMAQYKVWRLPNVKILQETCQQKIIVLFY
jgi:hydroxymethylglutaryl-CoA lyase